MIAIRGATTVTSDTKEEIKNNSIELFKNITLVNSISKEDIACIIFSCTQDIKSDYPGKYIRECFNLNKTAIMHFNEMYVEGSLPLCIRILILADKPEIHEAKYVYLNNARILRKDLSNF